VLCTDNAAMIASAARYCRQLPYPQYLGLDAYATGEVGASIVSATGSSRSIGQHVSGPTAS